MKKARACFADGGQISKADQLIAEMNAKYGVSGNSPAPAPVAQQPAPQPQQAPKPQSNGLVGDAMNLFGNRQKQIDKASGYANGGLIEGIGTPTSDSIPARVKETGEDISVSTKERIVSHEQDKLLQRLAKAMGFDSVDAFFEAGTGKPVGPTIKGGKKAAAGGWSLDNNPDEYAKAMQATRNTLSIPSLSTNNSAAQGGIYKDVGLPAISMGAGQAPTIYDNGGLPTKTDRVSGSLPVATAQNSVSPSNDGPRPWYAGASSADNRTGLEMERGRRAEATSAGVMNDPVKSALQYGVVGQNGTAQAPAQSPVHASNPLSAGVLSDYGNEGRGVPAPITKQNPSTIVDNQFTEGGKNYTVNPTSQDGIKRVTAQGTSPLYTNIDPQKAVTGLKDQMIGGDAASVNEGLARYAKANAIRQSMIDAQPTGGIAVLPDYAAQQSNPMMDKFNSLAADAKRSGVGGQRILAEFGSLMRQQMGNDASRYGADVSAQRAAGHDQVLMRGQDLNAQNELTRLQGNPLDNQTKQLSLTQAQQIGKLQDTVLNGKTPEEQAAAGAKIRALSGKQDREDRTVKPMEIADPNDPTGQRKILVRPNDDGTYTPMQPRRTYAEFAQAYLSKKPGTSPEQMKADYEQLYGSR